MARRRPEHRKSKGLCGLVKLTCPEFSKWVLLAGGQRMSQLRNGVERGADEQIGWGRSALSPSAESGVPVGTSSPSRR